MANATPTLGLARTKYKSMGVDFMQRHRRVTTEAVAPNEQAFFSRDRDKGFSMVEIVVSMFLIGIIAVSVLPVLIQALKASAANITVATSNQMINEEMDAARGAVRNCDELQEFLANTRSPVTDSQNIELRSTRTGAGDCTDTKLGAATLTIRITRGDTGAVVATASTLLSVLAATPSPSASPSPSTGP